MVRIPHRAELSSAVTKFCNHQSSPSVSHSGLLVAHPHHQPPQHEVRHERHDGDVEIRSVDVVRGRFVGEAAAHLLRDPSPVALHPTTHNASERRMKQGGLTPWPPSISLVWSRIGRGFFGLSILSLKQKCVWGGVMVHGMRRLVVPSNRTPHADRDP